MTYNVFGGTLNHLAMRCRHHPIMVSTVRCSQQAINGRLHRNASHWLYSTACCRERKQGMIWFVHPYNKQYNNYNALYKITTIAIYANTYRTAFHSIGLLSGALPGGHAPNRRLSEFLRGKLALLGRRACFIH